MPWIYLLSAGACEVLWAIGLKLYGFRWTWQSGVTIVLMLLSFWLLQMAMRTLPLSMSYAIWTGIGAAGTAMYGMFALKEPRGALQVACIGLIIAGIAGLKFLAPPDSRVATPVVKPDAPSELHAR